VRLIDIAGFPRTGTSWLRRAMLASPDCCGVSFEQGLQRIWGVTIDLDLPKIDEAFSKLVSCGHLEDESAFLVWLSLYASKASLVGRVEMLDRLIERCDRRAWVRRVGVPIAMEKKTTNLARGPSFAAFCLLETRLRGADSRISIQERLSRTQSPRNRVAFPKVLWFLDYDRLRERLARKIVVFFSIAIGTPRPPPTWLSERGKGQGRKYRKNSYVDIP
jgi:hypothetical protein